MSSFRAYQRFRRTYADLGLDQVRRLADVLIAGVLLALTAPLFLLVALAIKWEGPGPIWSGSAASLAVRAVLRC